jgi:hypothetical protein
MTIGPTSTAKTLNALTKVRGGKPRRLPFGTPGTLRRLSYVRLLTDKTAIFC